MKRNALIFEDDNNLNHIFAACHKQHRSRLSTKLRLFYIALYYFGQRTLFSINHNLGLKTTYVGQKILKYSFALAHTVSSRRFQRCAGRGLAASTCRRTARITACRLQSWAPSAHAWGRVGHASRHISVICTQQKRLLYRNGRICIYTEKLYTSGI